MGVLLVVPAGVVVIGLAVGLRQAEQRTFTFTEPVRRVEAGAVAAAGLRGDVDIRTQAGRIDLVVPDQRYAVEAGSAAGRTVVELVGDPTAPRRLVAHSNAGRVQVRRR